MAAQKPPSRVDQCDAIENNNATRLEMMRLTPVRVQSRNIAPHASRDSSAFAENLIDDMIDDDSGDGSRPAHPRL